MSKPRVCCIGLILLSAGPSVTLAAPGSTAENFLKLGLAPRPVSLGGAFTGLADDINAIDYNPAGLAFLKRQEAAFMHNLYVQDARQDTLAYVHPFGSWGSCGVSVNSVEVAPFNAFDANDQSINKVSAQDLALGAAYALSRGRWGVGARLKYLSSRLDNVRANGEALDLGALYAANRYVRAGASVQNLGPDFKFAQESFPLPVTGRVGASARLPLRWTKSSWLTLTAEGVWARDRDAYPAAGLELEPLRMIALRVGYDGRQDAGMGLTAGAGLRLIGNGSSAYSNSHYPKWFPDMNVDYAFVDLGDLGNAHRFSILLKFGPATGSEGSQSEPKESSNVDWFLIHDPAVK